MLLLFCCCCWWCFSCIIYHQSECAVSFDVSTEAKFLFSPIPFIPYPLSFHLNLFIVLFFGITHCMCIVCSRHRKETCLILPVCRGYNIKKLLVKLCSFALVHFPATVWYICLWIGDSAKTYLYILFAIVVWLKVITWMRFNYTFVCAEVYLTITISNI